MSCIVSPQVKQVMCLSMPRAGGEVRRADPSRNETTQFAGETRHQTFERPSHDHEFRIVFGQRILLGNLVHIVLSKQPYLSQHQLVLRKVRLLGQDDMDEVPEEDPLAKHDAEFVIMAGAFKSLVAGFSSELGGFVS